VLPAASALTTQQAARLLGVSRPHVVSLLEAGRIPFHMVGKHRRIRVPDLLAYREKNEKARKKTLDDLAAEDQALGIS
ncbi:MAG: helix-turn-helix domain-containing protein, partial [Candidatus Binatia bacterium]